MKLNKIKVALFAAGVLASFSIYAADSIHSTDDSTALSTGHNANAWGDQSTAVGDASVAGGDTATDSDAFLASITLPAYVADEVGGFDGKVLKNKDGDEIVDITDWVFDGDNTKSVAIGSNANALYGEVNDTTGLNIARRYAASTAIGADSLAMNGGTAVGNEAWAIGRDSVAIGKEAKAYGNKTVVIGEDAAAWVDYGTAVGNGAQAEGDDSTALGADAEASGENSVALGAGSVADRDNNVSVGSEGAERTISNVAPGVYGTDAVNVNQLKAVERKISAGVSAAMAMTTPVIAAGKSNAVALGAASYNNTSAIALNLAHKFTDDVVATASVSKGFNSGRTSSGNNDDIGIKGSVSWSF